jgi:CO/xanthine dehydrogenase FAD-binding subunit
MKSNTRESWDMDANASLQSVFDDPACPSILRQTLVGPLTWQVRNETSVQKTLKSARIAPQWIGALLALGTTVTVEKESGSADVPLETYLQDGSEGKATTLRVDVGEIRWGMGLVARTPADEPIVAAFAAVELDADVVREARVALVGVWQEPVRLAQSAAQLVGGPLDTAAIQAVAQAVAEEVSPKGDFRGSEEYRRAMAGVLTRRALETCLRQEVGDE